MNYSELKKTTQKSPPYSFASNLEVFSHHFPGQPLMPGALSGQLLAEACRLPGWFLVKIAGLRFRKPLTPDLPIEIVCLTKEESATARVCYGSILNGVDIVADGEFTFSREPLSRFTGASPGTDLCIKTSVEIREYLPHGEPIVLVDKLVELTFPVEVQKYFEEDNTEKLDQSKLVGTRVHTRTNLEVDNYWLDGTVLPSPILSELVAQAGALTLAPFFKGTKPQVSLLGCDADYYGLAEVNGAIDTFVDLTRVKRLGNIGNMILFSGKCFVAGVKIADVKINAMAMF
jgi:3-hydroxymyristoyl/3-hydroxydecanoyl-(acyl carrier protein) dehydratase